MMSVSLIYEVAEVVCELCSQYFVSVIETDMIEWPDGKKEIRFIEEVQCDNCKKMTKVNR